MKFCIDGMRRALEDGNLENALLSRCAYAGVFDGDAALRFMFYAGINCEEDVEALFRLRRCLEMNRHPWYRKPMMFGIKVCVISAMEASLNDEVFDFWFSGPAVSGSNDIVDAYPSSPAYDADSSDDGESSLSSDTARWYGGAVLRMNRHRASEEQDALAYGVPGSDDPITDEGDSVPGSSGPIPDANHNMPGPNDSSFDPILNGYNHLPSSNDPISDGNDSVPSSSDTMSNGDDSDASSDVPDGAMFFVAARTQEQRDRDEIPPPTIPEVQCSRCDLRSTWPISRQFRAHAKGCRGWISAVEVGEGSLKVGGGV